MEPRQFFCARGDVSLKRRKVVLLAGTVDDGELPLNCADGACVEEGLLFWRYVAGLLSNIPAGKKEPSVASRAIHDTRRTAQRFGRCLKGVMCGIYVSFSPIWGTRRRCFQS